MTKLKAIKESPKEKCPYCCGTGEVSPSPAVRLRTLRQDQGLSQKDFGDMAGISRAQVANLEAGRGNFSVDLLLRISDRFEISIDWLLGRDVEK